MTELNKFDMFLEQAQACLNGKTEHRVLVKEEHKGVIGTFFPKDKSLDFDNMVQMDGIFQVLDLKKNIVKWQVGVPVPVEVDGKLIFYCSKCKGVFKIENTNWKDAGYQFCKHILHFKELRQLIIVPLRIWKEKLLDITEKGAKVEGVKEDDSHADAFIRDFTILHKGREFALKQAGSWNPDVWCISFKIFKGEK